MKPLWPVSTDRPAAPPAPTTSISSERRIGTRPVAGDPQAALGDGAATASRASAAIAAGASPAATAVGAPDDPALADPPLGGLSEQMTRAALQD